MVLTLVLAGGRWGRHPRRLAVAAAPLVFLGALVWWMAGHVRAVADIAWVLNSPAFRLRYLPSAVPRLPLSVIEAVGSSVSVLGLALLPILLASFQRRQFRLSVVAAVTLATLLALGAAYDPPLAEHQIWALGELGTAESLVPGYSPIGIGRWTWILVPVVLMAGGQWIAAVLRWWRPGAAEVLLGSLLVGQFGLIALLWLFYDRYTLTLFVPALALVLVRQPVRRPAVAVVALAVLASLSALGMRDHLAYNHALWQAVRELQRRGRWLGRSGQIFVLERQERGRAVEGGGAVAPSRR